MTLLDVCRLLKKYWRFVMAMTVGCGLLAAVYAFVFLHDTYSTTLSMYVLTTSADEANNISNSDLSASQMLTNDVAALAKSTYVLDKTAASLGMPDLGDFTISVSSSTSTRIITLGVTGTELGQVAQVANELASTTDIVAQDIMGVTAVRVIDQAKIPEAPSGPNRLLYIAGAMAAGLFVSFAIIIIKDLIDTRIKSDVEVEQLLGVPVIGRFPEVKKAGR